MSKQEFFSKWAEEDLKKYHIIFGRNNRVDFTIYCWQEDNAWRIEEYEEHGINDVIIVGQEDAVFEELNKIAVRKKAMYENMKDYY